MGIIKEIKRIHERNRRVEADKAWETSLFRKITIAILTYIVIVIFFYFAKLPSPWINSIVPALAFLLSTLTLPFFKKFWINRVYNKNIKITTKKAQEEMVGFVVILLIVSIIAMIFLGISLRDKGEAEDSIMLENFLQSSLKYTSECAKSFEQEYLDVNSLIKECKKQGNCDDGRSYCEVLNETIKGLIESVFSVGEEKPTNYYLFKAYYKSNFSESSSSIEIYRLESGKCAGIRKGTEQIISALPGNINIQFEVCSKE